ncbi:Mor transcription activator family protein [Hespellia stercorisuis]|uniref:Mor transcription activator family protein n=1 Tax=Hespellia stercorisuis DSM 15480 TaxID=1121950 RepID=A0A1M6NUN8_9FIRM|nr:Mor transcription activator family protein [Hespellia stercorisuis]SHJ99427.1 Mor transcription activator family protein [Hespellia stercorisuis DSM 15480]
MNKQCDLCIVKKRKTWGVSVLLIISGKKEGLAEIYNQLVDIIGVENTEKIYNNLKGQQVTFPMRLYKTEYVLQEIEEKYDGKNLRELAKEYGYTERYLRTLLKKGK